MEEVENAMESPLGSPDRRKFRMKVRGDCFLYTSFFMVKKWFLLMVIFSDFQGFQKSARAFFQMENQKNVFFFFGFLLISPVFLLGFLILILMFILMVIVLMMILMMGVFLLLVAIFFIDLPLLMVVAIQSSLFYYTITGITTDSIIDLSTPLAYFILLAILVIVLAEMQELSNAVNNILFIMKYFEKKASDVKNLWLVLFLSIFPQIIQLTFLGVVFWITPHVLYQSIDFIGALRNFSILIIILHVNLFMTQLLRETKYYDFHDDLFQKMEARSETFKIYFACKEIKMKITQIKSYKIYNDLWCLRYDTDYDNYKGLYGIKVLLRYLLMGGMILRLLSIKFV